MGNSLYGAYPAVSFADLKQSMGVRKRLKTDNSELSTVFLIFLYPEPEPVYTVNYDFFEFCLIKF